MRKEKLIKNTTFKVERGNMIKWHTVLGVKIVTNILLSLQTQIIGRTSMSSKDNGRIVH